MPSFCAVLNCNRYGHSENISFHKFPLKRQDLLKSWESFIQKQRGSEWRASRWSSLCSRHFRESDFRSLNERKTLKKSAVPTILVENKEKCENSSKIECMKQVSDTMADKEFKEILAIREQLEDVGGVSKTNCRLCGANSVPVVSFATNYELYGILQKCFPTINIQQGDSLPKDLCSLCYKNLQNFANFVDVVWAAQTELQKKYKTRAAEKPLKIKQEPLVRVKQEVSEIGYDQNQELTANDDYEVTDGIQEEGEDSGAVDQKYEFCDFPIINDCDIMEIINLDDPFINIPDDDNTTTANEEHELQGSIKDRINQNHDVQSQHLGVYSEGTTANINDGLQKPTSTCAHELLQAHLLLDEHNYAYVDTEDFKEERHVYKTEKSDYDERLTETSTRVDNLSNRGTTYTNCNSYRVCTQNSNDPNIASESITSCENRALKPIVTSVSAIQQPSNKGNGIVVLNESIVKSGSGFQFHVCIVCQLKFFSVESLKEHYTKTHGTPMVTVPRGNIILERSSENACKVETEIIESTKGVEDHVLCKTNSNLIDTRKQIANDEDIFNKVSAAIEIEKKLNLIQSKDSKGFRQHMRKDVIKYKTKGIKRQKNENIRTNRHRHAKQNRHISLNAMASQYIQLKKLYQTLQTKCLNLELEFEQLQLLPSPKVSLKKSQPKGCATIKNQSSSATKSSFSCLVCSKTFSNSNSLSQHKITHTEEKKHICNLCQRSFKRRNGLNQHMRGFHLKVKPFKCQVCNHSYALKSDMLRCKHSSLKTVNNI